VVRQLSSILLLSQVNWRYGKWRVMGRETQYFVPPELFGYPPHDGEPG